MLGSRKDGGKPGGPSPEPSRVDPYANQLDKVGTRKRILRIWQKAYVSRVGKQIEFMQFGADGLRPLIWLHSVEYPMSPPWGLCVDAADAGFSIVSVRRPGFGASSLATDLDEEARILSAFVDEAGFENAVLIVEGTSRPVGLRLAKSNARIAFTVLARPAYVAEGFGDIDPWLRDLILQTMQTRAGAAFSLAAITQLGRTSGYQWLYENFLKLECDSHFIRSNGRDLAEAWDCVRAIKGDTFRREMKVLEPDPTLVPGALEGLRGLAVIGADTPSVWRNGFEAKSASIGIETHILPTGALFAIYQNHEILLQLLKDRC
jgi:pimeloyl-ACP methyl ester carboxylesterase